MSEEFETPEIKKEEFETPEIDTKELLESISIKTTEEPEEPEKPETKNKVESKITLKEEEDLEEDLFKEFRTFLEIKADIVEDKKEKATIPTGINLLDAVLGGGFVVGALNIIVGQPGSGKSMLAMQTIGQGQRKYEGKMLCGYLDSEESTTSIRLANLGVRYPKIKPYTDITVEKVFKFIEGLSVFKTEKKILETPSVLVWDSIANTLSEKERQTDDPNTVIGYKARLLSILIPKYVAKCAQHNICFLAVNQLRDVLAMNQFAPARDLKFMSASKSMPGGNILKFNAFQLLEMKIKSAITGEKAEKYGFEGIIAKLKCVKNKLFPPNIEVEIVGSFTTGFSNFWTNFNFLSTNKRLKTGAWNYLISLPDKKFRTKDAQNLYKTDIEFKEEFDRNVIETIQVEIIDKYNPKID